MSFGGWVRVKGKIGVLLRLAFGLRVRVRAKIKVRVRVSVGRLGGASS